MADMAVADGRCSDAIIDAALTLAAENGWHGVSLADIAARAGCSFSELRTAGASKAFIARSFFQRLDDVVWSGALPDAGETPRDRLFDVIMRRFEAMQPHRAGIRALARGVLGDPWLALVGGPRLLRAAGLMLEVSGISASGPAGRIKTHGLLGIYLATTRVWLTDESVDMSRTMAALDRYLRAAESIVGVAWRRPQAAPSGGGPEEGLHA
jgi:hypothetical protein